MLAKGRQLPDAYLRVFVDTDGPVPGISEQVRDALPGAVDVKLRYDRTEPGDEGPPLSSLEPRDQFLAYFRREHGVEAVAEDLVAVFDEVFEEVQGGGP